MRHNRIITGFAALSLIAAAAGCTKSGSGGADGLPTALKRVDARQESVSWNTSPRALPAGIDLLSASLSDRDQAGHTMQITIGGFSAAYKLDGESFTPAGSPVIFPNSADARVDFRFGADNADVSIQDGSPERFLDADLLVAVGTFSPAESLSGITLTHDRSLVEIVFDGNVDAGEVGDITVDTGKACKNGDTGSYLAVILSGNDSFTVMLFYKGIFGYSAKVKKGDIVGSEKEFLPNRKYRVQLGVNESDMTLILQAVSIADWINSETL